MATQALAALTVSEAGFAELEVAEMARINGGGWFAIIKGFVVRTLTWEIFAATVLWDLLMDPQDCWDSIMEGFDEFAY